MGWRILVRHPMLKLKTHSGFHELFLNQLFHSKGKLIVNLIASCIVYL
jgi:hypothetical protein